MKLVIVSVLALLWIPGCANQVHDPGQSNPVAPEPAMQNALELPDASGDAGALPCSEATDLLNFRAEWGTNGVHLNYTFANLAAVGNPATVAQYAGSCFWSYTGFVAQLANRSMSDSVYMDYNGNPAVTTGWRFYLHESGIELEAHINGNDIHVIVPFEVIGEPSAGDRFGDFSIQVSNSLTGSGVGYQTDWAPDNAQPCECWLTY